MSPETVATTFFPLDGGVAFMAVEKDPNGIDQHQPGAKLDHGKNRLGLVLGGFARALQEVGKVGTFGANKYTDNGWKQVSRGKERYTDALMRHLLAEFEGEKYDQDSKIYHAAHLAWNALARLEFVLNEVEIEWPESDDRINHIGQNGNTGEHYVHVGFIDDGS